MKEAVAYKGWRGEREERSGGGGWERAKRGRREYKR